MTSETEIARIVRQEIKAILDAGEPYTGMPLVDPETSLLAPPVLAAIREPLETSITDIDESIAQLEPAVASLETLVEDGRLSEPNLTGTYGPVAIAASPEMSATYDALASGLRQTSEVYRRATTTVMSSPPTVAVNAATSLTGGVLVTAANSPIQFENCVPLIEGTSLRQRRGAIPAGLATAASNNPFQVSFGFYGLRFELRLTTIDAAADVWIWVDGQPVGASPTALGAAGNKFVLVTFGSVGHRTITVINRRATYLHGVLREPTYSVFPPDHGGGPRVAVLGDSLSISTGSSTLMHGWVPILARLIGWPNVVACGEGGTGYVAAANPLYDYVTRVQDVASLDPAPDLVIVAGSQNDSGQSGVQAAAEACYVALRAALPGVPIIATTVLKPTSRSAGIIAVDDALIAATTAQDVPLIDCRDWFTGSGNVGSPSGVGNSDYFCSADGAHPSQAGHQFIANRITNALRDVGVIAFGV